MDKAKVELDGDSYIVVRGTERIRCENLEMLRQILFEFGWNAEGIEILIQQFRGGLLDVSPR
jgi:hypothetical protein